MTDYADLLPLAHQAVDLAHDIMTTMQPGVLTARGDRDNALVVSLQTVLAPRFLGQVGPGRPA